MDFAFQMHQAERDAYGKRVTPMPKARVMILYNQPVLPRDHIDAESEHSVVAIADEIKKILASGDYETESFPLAADPTVLWHALKERQPDVVFNLFEGNLHNPETESYVTGLMEWFGVPHTGSPLTTLTLARAKHLTKYLLKGAGLATADFFIVDALPVPEAPFDFPVIVKPAKQDASVGVDQKSVCTSQQELADRVEYVLATYGAPVIVEQYIKGREFNLAVIELPDLKAMPPSEIMFRPEKPGTWGILTYDSKWNPGTADYETEQPKFPADLPKPTARKLMRLAEKTFRVMGCRDYARIDFRMNAAGKPFVLEVNPNPEISGDACFASCLKTGNIAYPDFVVRIVEQALSRRHIPTPTFDPKQTRKEKQAV